MNICPDCVKAQTDWTYGGYHAKCDGCNLRGIALSPKHIRERFYELTLEKEGGAALMLLKPKVSAEYGRIQRLKGRAE